MTSDETLGYLSRLDVLADYSMPFAVGAVASLEVAECFEAGPRPVDQVAAERRLEPNALRRLLRSLVSRGLFAEPEPGVFALTGPSEFLLRSHPCSLTAAYMPMAADVRAWGQIIYSLRTGKSAFEYVHGESLWEYLALRPETSAQFDSSMAVLSRLETLWLLDAYDWTQFTTVVDVGGGNGSLLLTLLREFPALRGTLLDRPQVIERVMAQKETADLEGRCQLECGDFFVSVPAGSDAYVLKRIIYSYGDADANRILNRVRSGMKPHSRLLILEPVLRRGNAFDYGKLLDMQMLILGGGRVRDRHALRDLLKSAGFRLRRVIPTPMVSIVEALPE